VDPQGEAILMLESALRDDHGVTKVDFWRTAGGIFAVITRLV